MVEVEFSFACLLLSRDDQMLSNSSLNGFHEIDLFHGCLMLLNFFPHFLVISKPCAYYWVCLTDGVARIFSLQIFPNSYATTGNQTHVSQWSCTELARPIEARSTDWATRPQQFFLHVGLEWLLKFHQMLISIDAKVSLLRMKYFNFITIICVYFSQLWFLIFFNFRFLPCASLAIDVILLTFKL